MRGLVLSVALLLAAAPAGASFIDYAGKVITCKIVYYGATKAPLSENLAYVHGQTSGEAKDPPPALERRKAKKETYDFLPLTLGEIRGFKTVFHLFTVPTAADANATRLTVLKGTDAVVFVADNDPAHLNETIASWQELKRNLAELGYAPGALPVIVQLDHREAGNTVPPAKLKEALGLVTEPVYEAVVPTGVGVFETLKATAKQVLTALKKQ